MSGHLGRVFCCVIEEEQNPSRIRIGSSSRSRSVGKEVQ